MPAWRRQGSGQGEGGLTLVGDVTGHGWRPRGRGEAGTPGGGFRPGRTRADSGPAELAEGFPDHGGRGARL